MTSTRTSGIHRTTGQLLAEDAHIAQSIGDILSTPLGTRVMRENYGSLVPELIDQPQSPTLDLRLMAATFMAIVIWEPRIKPTSITLGTTAINGRRELLLQASRADGPSSDQAMSLTAYF